MSSHAQPKIGAKGEPSDLSVDEELLSTHEGPIPRHAAFIMDGNGRWAQGRGLQRIKGHRQGAGAVRRVVESCRYLGVDVVTLYAFSTQNWGRPEDEVTGLMTLFNLYIKKERARLIRNGIRLQVIGDRSKLSEKLQQAIADLEERTAANTDMLLQVAVSYGGREEILRAARGLAKRVQAGELSPEDIDEDCFERELYTHNTPDPDLVVRTSGELRVSNFLLWQIAYSELYVTDTLWPDFDEETLLTAFGAYAGRQRRFGKTGEQIEDSD
jgi:undecaprenyl diphosphate synthase